MLELYLNRNEEKEKLEGFPWIYNNEVHHFKGEIKSGEICKVLSSNNEFICYGFFNSSSKIMVRILSFNEEEKFDYNFYKERIAYAISHRQNLNFPNSNSCRLIFSEADYLPGLVVDKYDQTLVLQITSLGMDKVKDLIVKALVELLAPKGIYERSDSPSRLKEGLLETTGTLYGEVSDEVMILENGIKYLIDIKGGQKTGYFLDQKLNRDNLKYYVKDKIVLDCFSNIGGFALNALKNGAKEVVAVDISKRDCKRIADNAELNGFSNIEVVEADVFEFLKREEYQNKFDIVVLDPPAFTKNKDTVKQAYRGYKEINLSALKMLKSGGYLMTFSCSQHMNQELFIQMLKEALKDSKREGQFISFSIQAPDHPTLFSSDEQSYLKEVIIRVK